ncbi:MAG: F0F1 ATP synthase subunit epsilon [Anaerolineae bacterium]|nr:F0F1 ATP synthase subunit epsilon [Anaerolineae bacterium]
MTTTMRLEVITPDRTVVTTEAESLRIQLSDGWWGILPGHAPFIAHILAGMLRYQRAGQTYYVALYQGTVEVQKRPGRPDRVLVLTAAAEEGTEASAVQQALERQASDLVRLAQETKLEFTQARAALEHALREAATAEAATTRRK